MDFNVAEYVAKATSALQGDKNLLAQFTKNPVKALESILGVDLPDEVINKVIEAVKAQLAGGVADAATDAAGTAADVAKEGSSILGKAVDAIKKLF